MLVLAGCVATTPPVVTKPQPGLEASPTRPSVRQLPAALDFDPTRDVPTAPLEFAFRQPEVVTLSNGLPVYLLEDHHVPLVLVRALAVVGTVDDPAPQLGLTTVTAALLSEGGAGALGADALDQLMEGRAADLGSGAGDETSQVSLSLRADDLERLLPAFADVVQRPRFDEARFAVVIARVQESIRRREDRPDGVAFRALQKAVFGPTSLLGREPTEATVKAITLDDVKRWHAKTFGAKGTRLIVTGDFDRRAVLALLEAQFGKWKGGAPLPRAWGPPPQLKPRVIVVPRKIAQAKVRLGAAGYQRLSPDEYPLRVLATSLGSFGVGRLYKEIRDERGLAYSASASVAPGPTTGLFTAQFDTRPEQVGEALKLALQILGDTRGAAPLTPDEVKASQDMAINAFAFRFDGAAKIALEQAQLDLLGYPADYLQQWRARLGAVTPAATQKVSARLEGVQVVIVGPVDKMGDLSAFGEVITVNDVERFF